MNIRAYKTTKLLIILVFTVIVLILGYQPIYAQSKDDESTSRDQFLKIDSVLVNLPVIVIDKENNPIKDLTIEDFTVFSDKKKQVISIFETSEDPLQVVIMLDVSDSLREHFKDVQKSAIDFVKMLRPKDKAMMVTFDCSVHTLNDFTSDTNLLVSSINKMSVKRSFSGTCIYDSLYEVVENYLKNTDKSRKAIILLTDGVDNNSKKSFSSLQSSLASSNVAIYTILYDTSFSNKNSKSVMDQLVTFTGGRKYKAEENSTKRIFQVIAKELQCQYKLGFYPDNDDRDTLHDIKVEVTRPNVKVKTRQSYYISYYTDK